MISQSETTREDSPSRIAECAAMLIVVTRMMLDAEPKAFADWLRGVADDIEAEGRPDEPADHADRHH
jgi:hypothetical protein